MKKIKKKKSTSQAMPAFLIGWTHGESPPPGYVAAWFNQAYGGPLRIRFLASTGHHHFEAAHTHWFAELNLAPPAEIMEQWQDRLQWDHRHLGLLLVPGNVPADRRDTVLHAARMAKGISLLTDGTAYDVATGIYLNPSDWRDRELAVFHITDHVQVEQREDMPRARMWLHTRGLTKFGLDEIETFQPIGLSTSEVEEIVQSVAEQLVEQGKNPKVGEKMMLNESGRQVTVVRHRTDAIYGMPVAFREFRQE
jgi:hypothetical protein